MTTFTATRSDHILTIRSSHSRSEARGSFAFTAGAAQGALRHSSGYRVRLVKELGSKTARFSSVQSYHLYPVVFEQSCVGRDEVMRDERPFALNRTVKPMSGKVDSMCMGNRILSRSSTA
jgi:hypothetical protein